MSIENLSDLVDAVKKATPPFPEQGPLFDLYRTLRNPNEENKFYKGQGVFADTKLYFRDNEILQPVAPCIQNEELVPQETMKNNGRFVLEIEFTYQYEYSSTGREEIRTVRDYVEIREREVYIAGVKPQERKAKEIIKDSKSALT